jgi:hypothetical protein
VREDQGRSSEILAFDDQVVCDGAIHPWDVPFDGRDRHGEPFVPELPVLVDARISFMNTPDPAAGLRVVEEFDATATTAAEPTRLDVTDVRFTPGGAIRVDATITCPPGYAPVQDPAFAPHPALMVLDQSFLRHTDGSLVNRNSRRRDFASQIVCDGSPRVVALRFSSSDGHRRFRQRAQIRVTMTTILSDGDSHILAIRQELFRGLK